MAILPPPFPPGPFPRGPLIPRPKIVPIPGATFPPPTAILPAFTPVGGPPYLIIYCWVPLGAWPGDMSSSLQLDPALLDNLGNAQSLIFTFPGVLGEPQPGFVGYPAALRAPQGDSSRDAQLTNTVAGNKFFNALEAWSSPLRTFEEFRGFPLLNADCYTVISINNIVNRSNKNFFYNTAFNGTGYAEGDTGTIQGGAEGDATYVITSVYEPNGAVGTFEITSSGSGGYSVGPHPTTPTSGAGDGTFQINITSVGFLGAIASAGFVESSEPYIKLNFSFYNPTINPKSLMMVATVGSLDEFSFYYSDDSLGTGNLGLIVADSFGHVGQLFADGYMYASESYPDPTPTSPFIDILAVMGEPYVGGNFTASLGTKSFTFGVAGSF
jgi:hypothetical protein